MKILLVCAGGMSTSILVNKLKKWAVDHKQELEIKAIGFTEVDEEKPWFDVVLLGPRVSYKKKIIEDQTSVPVGVIAPYDYAIGNTDKIWKQAEDLIAEKAGLKA
jgi:PTS system cellobiose-specific IIB component